MYERRRPQGNSEQRERKGKRDKTDRTRNAERRRARNIGTRLKDMKVQMGVRDRRM